MRISDWSSDVCSSDLGAATVTNAAGALIGGDVYVAGATGILTNGGGIEGTVVLGQSIDNHSQTQIDTVTTTTQTVTPRSEERRVGKRGVSTCRSRWSRHN